MAAKHTAGPWKTGYALDNSFVMNVIDESNLMIIAEAYGATREEADANARLIAAALDLLGALQGLIRAGHNLNPSSAEWNAAHAAIAKATGAA